VCLLLQDLVQSCLHGGGGEDKAVRGGLFAVVRAYSISLPAWAQSAPRHDKGPGGMGAGGESVGVHPEGRTAARASDRAQDLLRSPSGRALEVRMCARECCLLWPFSFLQDTKCPSVRADCRGLNDAFSESV
jgi:hypothetical protein